MGGSLAIGCSWTAKRVAARWSVALACVAWAVLERPLSAQQASAQAAEQAVAAASAAAAEESADPAAEEPAEAPPKPLKRAPLGLEWSNGDVSVKLGGYLKVDLIHDFDDIGDNDAFDVRDIPTTGAADNGANTRLHARQTRLNLDIRGPSTAGDYRLFFEGDFFDDGNSFRMRHAYGTIRELLAGQTWTTFMDEDAMPETLDFESPVAFPQVRQTQVRWTHPMAHEGDYFAVSIEDPDSDVEPPPNSTGEVKEPYPDVNGRLRLNNPIGHVQIGAFAGMARFEPDVGNTDSVYLWGFNLATKLKTVGKDNAIVQYTFGDGVGRYRGGITAAPDADGDLEAVGVDAWTLSYQHFWSDEYRSSVGYSWAHGDLPAGASDSASERLGYGFLNWIWQFSDRAWAGVEYLYGTNNTFDGATGKAQRVQFSLRFDI